MATEKKKYARGKLYKAESPKGVPIVGTFERYDAVAKIDGVYWDPNGNKPEWAGESEIFWETAETQKKDGETLYPDENGNAWKASELVLTDPDQEKE
jgi:hypothetical protein